MRVNTKTGRLTLDKRERERLEQAKEIALGMGKHGSGKLQEESMAAAIQWQKMLDAYNHQFPVQKELALGVEQ